jgi:hypothetical protein
MLGSCLVSAGSNPAPAPHCARATRDRELGDQISDALGHLHRLLRVLDDNELDELAYGGKAPGGHYKRTKDDQERRI